MPRPAGVTDAKKTEAILRAANDTFCEQGFNVSLAEVARRAGVSKQTLYNRFGSKEGLLEEVVAARRLEIASALARTDPDQTLTSVLESYAQRVLRLYLDKAYTGIMTLLASTSHDNADLAQRYFASGPEAALHTLAAFLFDEQASGQIEVPDPVQAAEFFLGMLKGQIHVRALLQAPQVCTEADLPARAREAVARFLRAYAPEREPEQAPRP
ncbi:MAG: TetR/AcrR family transcriptional regulator [Asticcacaulis sp.]